MAPRSGSTDAGRVVQGTDALDGPRRLERKFRTDALSPNEVIQLLALSTAAFSEAYPGRTVNNLYLDDPAWSSYITHVAGNGRRMKVRVRWYGELFGAIRRPALELKIREGLVGRKARWALRPFALASGFSLSDVAAVLEASELPWATRMRVQGLELALLNSYYRRYFLSADRCFRVTVDCAMLNYGVRQQANDFAQFFQNRTACVIELKYHPDCEDEAGSITSGFPFRLVSNSKYVDGLTQLYA